MNFFNYDRLVQDLRTMNQPNEQAFLDSIRSLVALSEIGKEA